MMRAGPAVLLLLSGLVAGCGLEAVGHPLAVARVDPGGICIGDDHRTVLHLSARGSLPRAVLPGTPQAPDDCLVELSWEVEGSPYEVKAGAERCRPACPCDGDCSTDCLLDISLPGDRAAVVSLTVENQLGERDRTEVPVALTEPSSCLGEEGCCGEEEPKP